MTFKNFLIVMLIGTLGAWLAWAVILFSIDPVETSVIGFIFFYTTLVIALVGTFTIIGTSIRVLFRKKVVISRHVTTAFRQSILFSFLLIGTLIMISQDLLRWWSLVFFILVATLIELFFRTSRHPRQNHHSDN